MLGREASIARDVRVHTKPIGNEQSPSDDLPMRERAPLPFLQRPRQTRTRAGGVAVFPRQ